MSLMQQITADLRLAEICAAVALLTGSAALVLFFVLRIPACIRALTGLGRRRAIRKLGIDRTEDPPQQHTPTVSTVRKELSDQLIMETDILMIAGSDTLR